MFCYFSKTWLIPIKCTEHVCRKTIYTYFTSCEQCRYYPVKHKICVKGERQWNAVNAFFKYETERTLNLETPTIEIYQQEKNISVKKLFKVSHFVQMQILSLPLINDLVNNAQHEL